MNKLNPRQKKKAYAAVLIIALLATAILFMLPTEKKITIEPKYLDKIKYRGENILVIKPRFTEAAYSQNGFYSYYNGTCGTECLTIPLRDGEQYNAGSYNHDLVTLFFYLGYPMMNDSDIPASLEINPHFLDRYDTIILLHSEYVTQDLFDAITHHKNVIYLSPNALYGKITYQYETKPVVTYDPYTGMAHVGKSYEKVMTLIRGHNYPDKSIRNGFDWKYDNSDEEYDLNCDNWYFRKIDNGYQLNCVPELSVMKKPEILVEMKKLI